jgi:hypothetical protein
METVYGLALIGIIVVVLLGVDLEGFVAIGKAKAR